MFDGIRNYFYQRRRRIFTAAGVAGAVYFVGKYVRERLEDLRREVEEAQKDKDQCVEFFFA